MLDWINKKDNYTPRKSNMAGSLNRGILGFLSISSRIRMETTTEKSFIYRVSPTLKVLVVLFVLISVSLSRSVFYLLSINCFSLIILSRFPVIYMKKIFYIPLLASLFSSVILLPAVFMYQNGAASLMIILKVFTTVLSVSVYVYSTEYFKVTSSLRSVFIPDTVILLMDITFRYIILFGVQALELITAIKLRSIGIDRGVRTALLNSLGVLFIKTKNAGENLYNSMLTRGFNGKYPKTCGHAFSREDVYYASLFIIFVLFGYLI